MSDYQGTLNVSAEELFYPDPILKKDIKNIHELYSSQLFFEAEETQITENRRLNEKAITYYISSGDVTQVRHLIKNNVLSTSSEPDTGASGNPTVGELSERPLEQAIGIFISAITLFTRAAIDGGIPENAAYALSDSYIKYIFSLKDVERINSLTRVAMYDFTYEVYRYKYRNCSHVTRICCEYIKRHMHEKITLDDLAEACDRSPNYVSDSFASELGVRPIEFIREQKLEYAANILETANISVNALAYLLAFPSPSSFITYFKEKYGVTPLKYMAKQSHDSK